MDPMTNVSALGSTAGIKTASQGMVGLDGEAFMNLLVAQLRYQDPMAPTDANALMQQTSVLAQTELLTSVSKMQQQLVGLQRANIATDLIGKSIEGVNGNGQTVSGVVDGVKFSVNGPVLMMGNHEVMVENATRITATTQISSSSADGEHTDTSHAHAHDATTT